MGILSKMMEADDKRKQDQIEKYKITSLYDEEIRDMAKELVKRNAFDDYIWAGIQKEINGSTSKSTALLLNEIRDQNWIIIKQLDKVIALLAENDR